MTGRANPPIRLGVPVKEKVQASDSIFYQQTPAVNPAWGTLCPAAWRTSPAGESGKRRGGTAGGALWVLSGAVLPSGGHRRGWHCGALSGAALPSGGQTRAGGKAGTGAAATPGGEKPGLR